MQFLSSSEQLTRISQCLLIEHRYYRWLAGFLFAPFGVYCIPPEKFLPSCAGSTISAVDNGLYEVSFTQRNCSDCSWMSCIWNAERESRAILRPSHGCVVMVCTALWMGNAEQGAVRCSAAPWTDWTNARSFVLRNCYKTITNGQFIQIRSLMQSDA